MRYYFQTIKTFAARYKTQLLSGFALAAGAIFLVALFIYNYGGAAKTAYQPVDACSLFTKAEAGNLLGGNIIGPYTNEPIIQGDVAVSKCSYTDDNPDQSQMLVAAAAVRSGINDEGIKQNKADFAGRQKNSDGEAVKNFGDNAFFNETTGQLHILDGRTWIILSYGAGESPETNSIDEAKKLAKKILE